MLSVNPMLFAKNLNKRIYSSLLVIVLMAGCTIAEQIEYDPTLGELVIDGRKWSFVRNSSECERYIQAAVAEYLKQPIYHPKRPVEVHRFLTNDNGDCWVEVQAVGTSSFSFLFRVNEDNAVIDKRMFSKRAPHINDYPSAPYEQ